MITRLNSIIDKHIEAYGTDIIAQALQKVLDKMNMTAGLDAIIMERFDFWRYGAQLIRQMKGCRDEACLVSTDGTPASIATG